MTERASQPRGVLESFGLGGKVAMITGATGHLGGAMAEALAEAGASVIVCSRRSGDAQSLAAELPTVDAARHIGVALDHMDEASISDAFSTALRQVKQIDVLVNNGHEAVTADWSAVTAAQFDRQLRNATGYFLLARHLRDHAAARGGGGCVVMIGSMYGVVGSYPDVYEGISPASPAAYHALKGGVIQLTRHLAVYWAKDGVRVNCLSPGPFPSPQAPPQLVSRLNERTPMGRIGRPEELKSALVFLSSDASSYVTGHNLVIDGGWTAW